MRIVRWRAVSPPATRDSGPQAAPRPRLGVQLDPGPDGRGGTVVPLDRLPGLADDDERALALARADLAALLAADPGLDATRAGFDRVPDIQGATVTEPFRLLAPVHRPAKILGVGHNFREHVLEQGLEIPDRPAMFAMFANAVVGHGEPIVRPDVSHALDLEAELAVVIGRTARRVPESLALAHVAGWTVVNDVSARDLQGQKRALRPGEQGDGQWVRAKSSDTFLPMGPSLVTLDEVPDVTSLPVRSWRTSAVEGVFPMQDGSTRTMIFGVAQIIAFISHVVTLEPGDVIATGTPSGSGVWRDPPILFEPGDIASVEVVGIGRLDNPVVAFDGTVPGGSPAAALLQAL